MNQTQNDNSAPDTATGTGAFDAADMPASPEEAATRLARAEAQVSELRDAFLRAKAETDNVRKQGQAEVAKAYKYAIERFAQDLLPVKDALEQALAAKNADTATMRTGSELTLKALQAAFDTAKIEAIDPVGEPFDPHRHEAMQMVDAAAPPNSVVTVYQKGYLINDRVLRPALVTVARDAGKPA